MNQAAIPGADVKERGHSTALGQGEKEERWFKECTHRS